MLIVISPQRWRAYALCFLPCGEPIWLLASSSLSRLLYDHMKSWTSSHCRQWASFPFKAWASLSSKTSEPLRHTSFRISKDQLFSPVRMNSSLGPLRTFRASVARPSSCVAFSRYSPPHFLCLLATLLPLSSVPLGEGECFSSCPPGLSSKDP